MENVTTVDELFLMVVTDVEYLLNLRPLVNSRTTVLTLKYLLHSRA